MQGDTETKPLDRFADRVLQVGDAGARLVGGFEHIRANLLFVADIFVDRKTASSPSPMYFKTSPPCFLIGGTWQSK